MNSIRLFSLSFLLVLSTLISFPAFASDYDVLIQDLRGSDEGKRAVARQLLPREGMRAFPDLLTLLQNKKPRVWRTARHILSDICVATTAPGHEAERNDATDQLMALLESDVKLHVTVEVIRLLGKVAPEGYDLSPMTPFFKPLAFRSDTLDSLVVMSTLSAVDLLETQLNTGSTQDKVEIIDALRTIGLRTDYTVSESLLSKRNAEIHLAAMRALASTGDTKLIEPFLKTLRTSKGQEATQALDATLHLADSIMRNGGNWNAGIDLYRTLFNDINSFSAKGAALAGLGRYGDASVVAELVAVSHDAKLRDLEAPALMALNDIRGKESYEALLAAYPTAGKEMQLGLLGVMGRTHDPLFLALLLENAASDDPSRQALAFEALVQSEHPQGADAVTAYVASRPTDARKFDVEKLLAYADVMAHKNAGAAAGKAYLTVYETTDNAEFREIAFQGMKEYPSPDAYKIILSELDLNDLSDVSVETLIALNTMLDAKEYPEELASVRTAMYQSARSTAQVQSILDMANQQGDIAPFVPTMGFITHWDIVGPFPWSAAEGFKENPVHAPGIDLSASYSVEGQQRTWQKHTSSYIVDPIALYGSFENVSIFAHAVVHSESPTDAQVRIGTDDGIRLWLNGEVVQENNANRGIALDSDIIPIKLKQGKNELVAQITQGAGGWAFTLRLTKPDGTPIPQ